MLTESAEGDYKAAFKVRLDGNVVDEGEGKILTVNIHDIDNVEVTFVNTLTPPPTPPNKTGDNTPLAMLLLLCLTALTGLLILFLRRRRTA